MNAEQKIGIGSVQFGMPYGISNRSGQTPQKEVARILDYARQKDIRVLDTASAYGEAERILGKEDLTGFEIVSKFMPPEPGETISDQLERSLENLGLDSLYGYLAHKPEALLKHPEQWDEMKRFRENKQVEKVGYSLNFPSELERLLEAGFPPDLVQLPYNYFDRRFEAFFPGLKEKGCEIHVRSVFLQGLFFTDPGRLPEFFDAVKPVLYSLQRDVKHLSGALLKFALDNRFLDRAIVGINNCGQLIANMDALQLAGPLPHPDYTVPETILLPYKWPVLESSGHQT